MITIQSNGSKWYGQQPDSIERLIEVLSEHTLDPTFENYGNFITPDPIACNTRKPLYPEGTYQFFGNFRGVSHVFNIATDEPETIKQLSTAIRANQSTVEYQSTKSAMQMQLDAVAKELKEREERRERAREQVSAA